MIFLCVFFIPSPFAVYIKYFIERVMSIRVFRRRVEIGKFWRNENKLVVEANRIELTSSEFTHDTLQGCTERIQVHQGGHFKCSVVFTLTLVFCTAILSFSRSRK